MKQTLKLLLTGLILAGSPALMKAQVPQKFNYQGIARDSKGNPMGKQTLGIKLSVLPTSDATTPEYEEVQTITTNEFGLYTIQIGNGQAITGTMSEVKWETGNKYIRVSIDPKGGSNYVDAGTTQLLSVPYAIYADKAGLAKETAGGTRAGTVSTSAAGTGTVNYLTKFTAANTIYNSQVFDNGTNIGIGTTTPSAKVHVNQNVAAVQEHIRMQNQSATGAGRFTMYSDGASNYSTFTKYGSGYAGGYAGITTLYPYGNLLAFGNNGVAANDGLGRFLISSAGNVGISLFKGGTSKLKFHADFTTENVGIGGNSAPVSRVHLNNTDGTTMDLRLTNNTTGHTASNGMLIQQNQDTASVMNLQIGPLTFGTNNFEHMRINPYGNIGIGTTTPGYKLDVLHNGSTGIRVKSTGSFSVLDIDANSGDAAIRFANNGVNQWNLRNEPSTDNFQFFELGGGGERMQIQNSTGYVGIGGVNPNCILELGYGFTQNNRIDINSQGTLNNGLRINLPPGSSSFGISTSGSYLRLNSSIDSFATTTSEVDIDPGTAFEPWSNNTLSCGSSSSRWTAVYAVNGTIQTSDMRLKTQVGKINYGLNTLMQVTPISYNWKNDPSGRRKIGFSAQELEKVIPEVVYHTELSAEQIEKYKKEGRELPADLDTYGVNYADMVPVLVKAIQEQQAQIEALKQEVTQLKKQ